MTRLSRSSTGRKRTRGGERIARSCFEEPALAGIDVWALPRGQHGRAPAEIVASQRARIFYALVQSCAGKGYTATTLNDICQGAKLSKTSFYEQFADKEACFIAAYEDAHHELAAAVVTSQDREGDAIARSRDALAAYLRYNRDNPAVARSFLVEIHAAGPRAWAKRDWGHERFAAMTQRLYEIRREQQRGLPVLPPELFLALIAAVEEMVCAYVRRGWTARVMELLPRALFLYEAAYRAPADAVALLAEA